MLVFMGVKIHQPQIKTIFGMFPYIHHIWFVKEPAVQGLVSVAHFGYVSTDSLRSAMVNSRHSITMNRRKSYIFECFFQFIIDKAHQPAQIREHSGSFYIWSNYDDWWTCWMPTEWQHGGTMLASRRTVTSATAGRPMSKPWQMPGIRWLEHG